jgi:outer membrane receptor protein involved in Fe transport
MAHYEAFPLAEGLSDDVHVYSLTITDSLGFADLTSATAYWERQESVTGDGSESGTLSIDSFPSMSGAVLPGYVAIPYTETDRTQQFSQEIRITSKDSDRLHWIAGGFYSDLNSIWMQYSANPAFTALSEPPSANPLGIIFASNNPYQIRQYAAFADGSFKFTDALKLSAGVRWYRYLSEQFANEWGEDSASLTPLTTPLKTQASNQGINPRVDLSYSPDANLTTYVSASKGFRPGGANTQVPTFCGPSQTSFGPDSAWDYEVGEKARFFDNRLTVNSDFYYIKWTGVQEALLLACGYQYNSNAGNGRSFGPELEINAKLSSKWTVSGSGAYTDAKITQPSAALANYLVGTTNSCQSVNNCTVPILNVPKYTASLAMIYSTTVSQDYRLTARLSDSLVGPSIDESFNFGINLPSYNILNGRIGVSKDKWSATLFVTNITNNIAWMGANNTSFQFNNPGFYRVSTEQPRTFGTQVNYRF